MKKWLQVERILHYCTGISRWIPFKNGSQLDSEHADMKPSYLEGIRAFDWNKRHASGYSGHHRPGNAINRQSHTFSYNYVVHLLHSTPPSVDACIVTT